MCYDPIMFSADTSVTIERKQISIYQKMSPAQRLEIAFELSDNVRDISYQAFCKANPTIPAQDLKVQFLKRVLGWKLPPHVR